MALVPLLNCNAKGNPRVKQEKENRKENISTDLQDPLINGRSILFQTRMKKNQKETKITKIYGLNNLPPVFSPKRAERNSKFVGILDQFLQVWRTFLLIFQSSLILMQFGLEDFSSKRKVGKIMSNQSVQPHMVNNRTPPHPV
jgi:hypothetical protein